MVHGAVIDVARAMNPAPDPGDGLATTSFGMVYVADKLSKKSYRGSCTCLQDRTGKEWLLQKRFMDSRGDVQISHKFNAQSPVSTSRDLKHENQRQELE